MKHEHILGLKRNKNYNFNQLDQGIFYVNPMDVVVGHREYLDNVNNIGDSSVLQAIGYGVVFHPKKGYLAYKRKGSESRLNDKISIGFGGHTSILDIVITNGEEIDFFESVQKGLKRELSEELIFSGASFDKSSYSDDKSFYSEKIMQSCIKSIEYKGQIVCNKTPVDLLHIGLVSIVTLRYFFSEVSLGDHGKEFFWVESLSDLDYNNCEEWTKILIDAKI
jgi:predicted NUDIX family phosphoesterase